MKKEEKFIEAQRIQERTSYDIEMIREMGYCSGIENYSRHLALRGPGETPCCLMDFFPEDFLLVVDESHVTLPQLTGMSHGDAARKEVLVNYGFRLPCAKVNRPLTSEEIFEKVKDIITEQLAVADTTITMESSFIDDLGADSLDVVELIMALEETFDIAIPDEDAEKVQTVGDVVEYIKEHVA